MHSDSFSVAVTVNSSFQNALIRPYLALVTAEKLLQTQMKKHGCLINKLLKNLGWPGGARATRLTKVT